MSARPVDQASGENADGGLSRVPYLPGLDGLRAIAVVGVMIYHAHHSWQPGGYLGGEVFFVISGYLITLLLIGEAERTGRLDLGRFWARRFRRLLPALFVMMVLVAVYIAAFYSVAREQTRGDFMGGVFYISNWYQVFVGQGYGASEAFVPLRHLWSLAVEEQFYVLWPLAMLVILGRSVGSPRGAPSRRVPSMGFKLIGASIVINIAIAVLYVPGSVASSCGGEFTRGTTTIFGRCISVNDMLYLGSFSRAGGLMLGAGFAMLWRPVAIMRGPLRHKARQLDALAAGALALLVFFMATMYLQDAGVYNPWLYRGGLFFTGVVTLALIAATTHRGARTGPLLGNKVMLWIGTRSYGLYLYHWPVYQIIRKQANIDLSVGKLVLAMVITLPITEASYRFIETPIRKQGVAPVLAAVRRSPRGLMGVAAVVALAAVATFSLMAADPHCVGSVNCSLAANAQGPDTAPSVDTGVPSSTPVIDTTTTEPKVPQKYVAIGESVMVGAVNQLRTAGVYVDAKEDRGPEGVKNTVIKLRDAGELGAGTGIVIQVGTNAPMNVAAIAAIMAEVPADAGTVTFMTLHANVAWIPGNNELITSIPNTYPGVGIIDWDARAAAVTLCADGIHITCGGSAAANFYASLILANFGLPAIP